MKHNFSYIDKAADLTLDMVSMYKDSFILLGDEKQLYHPLTNSYVGIGQSAYDYLLNKIRNISGANLEIQVVDRNEWFNITMNNTYTNGFSDSYTSTSLNYNPGLEILRTSYFEGTLRGFSYYSGLSYYSNISYQQKVHYSNTYQTYYITFVNTDDDNVSAYSYVHHYLQYNPNDQTLKSTFLDGQIDPEDQWGVMGSE